MYESKGFWLLAWVWGQRKISHVLGVFGLLDFTMLRPVLTWRVFWNLQTVYFFLYFLSGRSNRRICGHNSTRSCWPLHLVCALWWMPVQSFGFWQWQEIFTFFWSSRLDVGSIQNSVEWVISVCICDFYAYLSLSLLFFLKEEPADHPSAEWWPNSSRYTWFEEFPPLTVSSPKAETL
jgi:hypothetical protein